MEQIEVDKLHKHFGQRLPIFLESLVKGKQFYNALNTPLGTELFTGATNRMEDLTSKLVKNLSLTDKEVGELRALRVIVGKWTTKLNSYLRAKKEAETIIKE